MSQTTAITDKIPATQQLGALTADGYGTVIERPTPEPGEGEILIRTTRSMVSAGTHLGRAEELRQEGGEGEPRPLGYQCAGYVAALGPGVTRFNLGDRVAGFGGGAKHARWNVVPQNLCVAIPDNVTDDQAAGMNLVLTAVQANRRAQPEFGEYFLIVGMGVVGQLCAQVAQTAGLYVMGWDALGSRLEIAQNWGIHDTQRVPSEDTAENAQRFTHGLGFDAAITAFGSDSTSAIEQIVKVMKITRDTHRMGRLVMIGGSATLRWGAAMSNLDVRSSARTGPGYHDKEWERGKYELPPALVRWNTQTNLELAMRWIAEKRLQIDPLITHHYHLAEFDKAVDLLVERPQDALGVIITSDDDE